MPLGHQYEDLLHNPHLRQIHSLLNLDGCVLLSTSSLFCHNERNKMLLIQNLNLPFLHGSCLFIFFFVNPCILVFE